MSLTFAYRARTPSGTRVSGTMRAIDRDSALTALRERLLIPSSLEGRPATFSIERLFKRPKPSERLAFFRAYAALERSGVDFSTSFALLIAQTRTARMRDALESIRSDVERGGEKLWVALSNRPDDFSDLEVAMVAAGEEAGNREEVFARLAGFLERDERLTKRLRAALVYPLVVIVSALAISVYLVSAVIPQFAMLFASFGVEPAPQVTALLSLASLFEHPLGLAAVAAGLCAATLVAVRYVQTPEGAIAFDAARLRIPVLGAAMRNAVLARLCRVLATMLESGVNLVRALEVAVPVTESVVYGRAIDAARDRIVAGQAASLDEALAETDLFGPLLLGFVRVGSSAGNVPTMLVKLAEYYEDDVESVLAVLPALVQTIVTLGLGAFVAAIVYVVYVPLSALSASIH
jgi:type II secretory pathway component PulF